MLEMKIITAGSLPLMTGKMIAGVLATVLWQLKVPGGTITVTIPTSMGCTSEEQTTVEVSGGTPSTNLSPATHTSGQR